MNSLARAVAVMAALLPDAALAVPLPAPRPPEFAVPSPVPAEPEKAGSEIPLPVPKPGRLGADIGPTPPPPGLVEAEVPPDPLPDPVCDALEAAGEVEFERLPRIMEGACGALTPIRISALAPKNGPRVTFESPVTVTCEMAKTALYWVVHAVQPAAQKHFGEPIKTFRQTGGYECRGRNRDPKAKISEHGQANALDIGGFERANGTIIAVGGEGEGEAELSFLTEIRNGACGPFTTVLGPPVAAHDEHFHFDLARRGKNGRTTYCR